MKSLAPFAALAAAFILSACDQKTEASRAAPTRPVLVAEAHYAPREQAQVLAGVVKARTESDLAFRIAGKMATRLVDMGALVHEGDALARLDETDFRLQLEEAEAEQSSAKAALVQAEAEERRLTTLSKQGWTANSDFDKAHAAADQARGSFALRTRASGRRRSPFPKRSSIARAPSPRGSSSGLCPAFPSPPSCASSRRRPIRRRAPIPRALRLSTRRPACASA